jgi:hypothetical protein
VLLLGGQAGASGQARQACIFPYRAGPLGAGQQVLDHAQHVVRCVRLGGLGVDAGLVDRTRHS